MQERGQERGQDQDAAGAPADAAVRQVAIVTGGSRGIGRAIAQRLAQDGYDLLLVARDGAALTAAAETIAAATARRVLTMPADLAAPAAADGVARTALAGFGRIDVLINNAGSTRRGPWQEMTEADWQAGFALKFFGAERLTRAAWPELAARGGRVVNIIGVGGRTPAADFTIGSSVNAACMALTKALAEQGIADGVRVNAVNPGMIATGRLGRWIEALARAEGISLAAAEQRLPQSMGIARVGTPEEIAAAAAFLVSPDASYCQGALLDVDGGRTRSL